MPWHNYGGQQKGRVEGRRRGPPRSEVGLARQTLATRKLHVAKELEPRGGAISNSFGGQQSVPIARVTVAIELSAVAVRAVAVPSSAVVSPPPAAVSDAWETVSWKTVARVSVTKTGRAVAAVTELA